MKHLFLSIAFALLSTLTTWAQLNLAGTVKDEEGHALEGAIILIRGTRQGTISQKDGRFLFQTSEVLPFKITVSHINHYQRELTVRGSNFRNVAVKLAPETILTEETVASASRVTQDIQQAPVTVDKLSTEQFEQSPALSPFDAIQYVRGVDLFTQSLLFKSVNVRGFGSNNNSRFLQLTDGMDNRSPGLGFGFGNVAGLPDLDVENIELVSGPLSALYGPDAMQGLMQTTSKDPFTYQGLSAQVKSGVNNVGKSNFGPKGYADLGIRYANQLGTRFAFKVSFQRITGTDFIADNYSDRSTRARPNFFATDTIRDNLATGLSYTPNNDPNTNFEYDGVNVYGDDINNGGAFSFPAKYANLSLQNKLVTRTGYTELDVLGNRGQVVNNRAVVSLHYKLSDNVEASLGWYYGNGNFIRTAASREYFPDYRRHQFKAELRGDSFFLRAYTTQQNAEGWNIGQTATAINNTWKSLDQWAAEFGQSYVGNKVTINQARATANRGRYLPGSAAFNQVRDLYANTYNTDSVPGLRSALGSRFRDNSQLWHYEGMYNFTNLFQAVEVIAGASLRHYGLESGGTLFSRQANQLEYTIDEVGAYIQAAKEILVSEELTIKPTVAIRYDKNQYLKGTLTPRLAAVASLGTHNLRASWQTGFHNPSPEQLFRIPATGAGGEVGGLLAAYQSAGLIRNPGYLPAEVTAYQSNTLTASVPKPVILDPGQFTTEKVKTWEIGYNTLINDNLYIDVFYFASRYTNLITSQTVYQLLKPGAAATALLNPANYRILQVNKNSANEIFVRGAGIALTYGLGGGFTLNGNYTYQKGLITLRDARGSVRDDLAGQAVVKRKMSDPDVTQLGRNYFNSPENRGTITLNNPHLTDRLGASLAIRWTGRMWVEQGITAGDVWLPAWTTVDAQISYKVPTLKSVIKLGGTNILNKYYAQNYGLARIGGLYYVSLTFDELMR